MPKPATYVTDITATLNADVYSSVEGTTTYWFDYGPTAGYGSKTPSRSLEIADDSAHPVSEPISGLSSATSYHWRVCASDEEEEPARVTCGKDQTFSTTTPGGRSGITFATSRDGQSELYVMDPDGGNQQRLTNSGFGDSPGTWSPDGKKVAWMTSGTEGVSRVYTMNPDGTDKQLIPNARAGSGLRWSPDGRKFALSIDDDVYVMDADGTNLKQLTTDPARDVAPAWSPDGSRIAFMSRRSGQGFWVMSADGSNQRRLTADEDSSPSWSPDGRMIVFTTARDSSYQELWAMNADGSNEHPVGERVNALSPSYSPDGKTIVFWFLTDTTGSQQVYAIAPDGTNIRNLTNSTRQSFNQSPIWSPRP